MQENNFNIELLPQGAFLITLSDGKFIKGRFSMYALNRFCESKGITYLEAVGKITLGMTIREYAELVLVGLQDMYREDYEQCQVVCNGEKKKWTVDLVMDLIFEPLGFGNKKMLDFFKHAIGRLTEIVEEPEADGKKKAGKRTKKN